MLVTDKGRSVYDARFHSHGRRCESEWLAGLLHSRELAACVVEVTGDGKDIDYLFLAVSPAFEAATGLKSRWADPCAACVPTMSRTGSSCMHGSPRQASRWPSSRGARLRSPVPGYAFRVGVSTSVMFAWCSRTACSSRPETCYLPRAAGMPVLNGSVHAAHELRGPLAALSNGCTSSNAVRTRTRRRAGHCR